VVGEERQVDGKTIWSRDKGRGNVDFPRCWPGVTEKIGGKTHKRVFFWGMGAWKSDSLTKQKRKTEGKGRGKI